MFDNRSVFCRGRSEIRWASKARRAEFDSPVPCHFASEAHMDEQASHKGEEGLWVRIPPLAPSCGGVALNSELGTGRGNPVKKRT